MLTDCQYVKGPRKALRIRPDSFDFEPDLCLKLGHTKPHIAGGVPTGRHTAMPLDYGPTSACFDDDQKRPSEPYRFIGFGAIDVTKLYKFIWFGDIDAPNPMNL